jgi:ribosomal protein S18 acetylase RimI-like enzyme
LASEVIDIRRFEASDFAPLLEAEARAWGEALHWDYAPSARIITACLADKRLPGYALVNQGRIEGYSFFVCEGGKGLIGDFFVLPEDSRREQAQRLLEAVLETLLATPGVRRVEAQLPHFDAAELEPCFGAHGFQTYSRRFMVLDLAARQSRAESEVARAPWPARLEEFALEAWERQRDRPAAQLLYQAYRGHVDAAINDQYASVEGAARLIENIVELRGCGERVPRGSRVAVHRPSQKLAAVLALTTVRPGTAHIPQIAVARDFQGLGLGTALLETAFQEIAPRGYREVSLTVTDLNSGAVRFYERLGFTTWHTFGAFTLSRS